MKRKFQKKGEVFLLFSRLSEKKPSHFFSRKRQTFQFLITEMGEEMKRWEEPKSFGKRSVFTLLSHSHCQERIFMN